MLVWQGCSHVRLWVRDGRKALFCLSRLPVLKAWAPHKTSALKKPAIFWRTEAANDFVDDDFLHFRLEFALFVAKAESTSDNFNVFMRTQHLTSSFQISRSRGLYCLKSSRHSNAHVLGAFLFAHLCRIGVGASAGVASVLTIRVGVRLPATFIYSHKENNGGGLCKSNIKWHLVTVTLGGHELHSYVWVHSAKYQKKKKCNCILTRKCQMFVCPK